MNKLLFLDVETVGDPAREHLWKPAELPVSSMVTPAKFLGDTVAVIKQNLSSFGLTAPDAWLAELERIDERKGVLDEVKRWRKAKQEVYAAGALTPEFCVIRGACFALNNGEPECIIPDGRAASERNLLRRLWDLIAPIDAPSNWVIGYNVRDFDLMVLAVRSIMLNVATPVDVPFLIQRSTSERYGVVDLMWLRWKHFQNLKGLTATAALYGIEPWHPELTADRMHLLTDEEVCLHCVDDLHMTRTLFQKWNGILWRKVEPIG